MQIFQIGWYISYKIADWIFFKISLERTACTSQYEFFKTGWSVYFFTIVIIMYFIALLSLIILIPLFLESLLLKYSLKLCTYFLHTKNQ